MTNQTFFDIDYEQMDDLPLSERVEWSLLDDDFEEIITEDLGEDMLEWLTV